MTGKKLFLLTLPTALVFVGLVSYGDFQEIGSQLAGFPVTYLIAALAEALPIYAAAMLVGAISTLPGGLVGTEGSMVALLQQAGITRALASTGTLLVRLVTLWFAVALGLAALVCLHRFQPTRLAPSAGGDPDGPVLRSPSSWDNWMGTSDKLLVSNQQKWDTLGAERSGAGWRSGELPEGPVVASSPFGGLSLHLLPAL